MRRIHSIVEWGFKEVCYTWKTLQLRSERRVGSSPLGVLYLVAVELTNFRTLCCRGNSISRHFGLEPPSMEEYFAPREHLGAVVDVPVDPSLEDMTGGRRRELPAAAPHPRAVRDDDDDADRDVQFRVPANIDVLEAEEEAGGAEVSSASD